VTFKVGAIDLNRPGGSVNRPYPRTGDPGDRVQSKIEKPKSKILEWELLPPEQKEKQAQLEPLFKWLALILDQFLRLPGTKFRFGLDPIIGLIPGIGDTASALISAFALVYAARCGLPKVLLARMSLNILINEIVGIVPGLGDAFSFWFKSNLRNYELLRRHIAAPATSRKSDWIFVAVVLAVLFIIVCAGLLVSIFVLQQLFYLLNPP
jgi:hypothetical protein